VLRLVGMSLKQTSRARTSPPVTGGEEIRGRAAQHRGSAGVDGRRSHPARCDGEELKKKSTGEILGRVTISVGVSMLKRATIPIR